MLSAVTSVATVGVAIPQLVSMWSHTRPSRRALPNRFSGVQVRVRGTHPERVLVVGSHGLSMSDGELASSISLQLGVSLDRASSAVADIRRLTTPAGPHSSGTADEHPKTPTSQAPRQFGDNIFEFSRRLAAAASTTQRTAQALTTSADNQFNIDITAVSNGKIEIGVSYARRPADCIVVLRLEIDGNLRTYAIPPPPTGASERQRSSIVVRTNAPAIWLDRDLQAMSIGELSELTAEDLAQSVAVAVPATVRSWSDLLQEASTRPGVLPAGAIAALGDALDARRSGRRDS